MLFKQCVTDKYNIFAVMTIISGIAVFRVINVAIHSYIDLAMSVSLSAWKIMALA